MNTVEKTINSIQKRPYHERRQIGMFVVTSFTALIFIVWISTLTTSDKKAETKTAEVASPFAIMKDNVVEIYADATKGYKSAKGE